LLRLCLGDFSFAVVVAEVGLVVLLFSGLVLYGLVAAFVVTGD